LTHKNDLLPLISLLDLLCFSSKSDISPQIFALKLSVKESTDVSARDVKNTFGIPVYSKEYTFPVLLLFIIALCVCLNLALSCKAHVLPSSLVG
jgi:hypothetical protein